jgi:hypothetical protein
VGSREVSESFQFFIRTSLPHTKSYFPIRYKSHKPLHFLFPFHNNNNNNKVFLKKEKEKKELID